MEPFKATLTGVAPIMFHSERLANPTDPRTRELKKLTSLRPKTDEILEEIKWQEWRAGFYERDGRPVVPSDNVLAVVVQGARKLRKGKDVSAGVIDGAPDFLLKYKGPKKIEDMRGNESFLDYRSVVVSRSRIMRARPIFRDWSIVIELLFDPDIVQRSELKQALEIGGERIGLCERRPRLGRFSVKVMAA